MGGVLFSAASPAPPTTADHPGLEGQPEWVLIRLKTFGRWAEVVLARRGLEFRWDAIDGRGVLALVEEVFGHRFDPTDVGGADSLAMVQIALEFLDGEAGVNLAGISAEAMVEGNVESVLAFLWVLVSRWLASIDLDGDDGDGTGTGTSDVGIGDSQAVLEWVADVTGVVPAEDGTNLAKVTRSLIDMLEPNLVATDGDGATDDASLLLAAAEAGMGIPALVDGDDADGGRLDAACLATYLVQFKGYERGSVSGGDSPTADPHYFGAPLAVACAWGGVVPPRAVPAIVNDVKTVTGYGTGSLPAVPWMDVGNGGGYDLDPALAIAYDAEGPVNGCEAGYILARSRGGRDSVPLLETYLAALPEPLLAPSADAIAGGAADGDLDAVRDAVTQTLPPDRQATLEAVLAMYARAVATRDVTALTVDAATASLAVALQCEPVTARYLLLAWADIFRVPLFAADAPTWVAVSRNGTATEAPAPVVDALAILDGDYEALDLGTVANLLVYPPQPVGANPAADACVVAYDAHNADHLRPLEGADPLTAAAVLSRYLCRGGSGGGVLVPSSFDLDRAVEDGDQAAVREVIESMRLHDLAVVRLVVPFAARYADAATERGDTRHGVAAALAGLLGCGPDDAIELMASWEVYLHDPGDG